LIQFTCNHTDHSTDKSYQFEFFCDRSGNGFMTEFKASAMGMAGTALRTVGNLFVGFLGSVGGSTYEIERAVQGTGHNSAIRAAIEEAHLTRGLALINFRREPVYLPDQSLEQQPEFPRYAIGAPKLPGLRALRAADAGRAIHSSLEDWIQKVDDLKGSHS
jgi:hypothetical protein